MTSLLSNWQMAKPNRAVVTLAGDVHIGGFTDSWVRAEAGAPSRERWREGGARSCRVDFVRWPFDLARAHVQYRYT